jgi:hypothetical protein
MLKEAAPRSLFPHFFKQPGFKSLSECLFEPFCPEERLIRLGEDPLCRYGLGKMFVGTSVVAERGASEGR